MGDYDECSDCQYIGSCDSVGCYLEMDDQEAAYEELCGPGWCTEDPNEMCCDCGECRGTSDNGSASTSEGVDK